MAFTNFYFRYSMANLFASILQASIRADHDVSAALDGLFARQSCNRHCYLQVWVGTEKYSISIVARHGTLSVYG